MRLIDADALKDNIIEKWGINPKYLDDSLDAMKDVQTLEWINSAPTIDAVSVVRCKDCKWQTKDQYDEPYCGFHSIGIYADNFCSYGEREDKCKECWYWSEVHKRCENKCGCQFKPYGEREVE